MPHRLLVAVCSLIAVLLLAGCGGKGVNTASSRGGSGSSVVIDNKLDGIAHVVNANEFQRGDTLVVQAGLENSTGRDASFLTRWEWYEENYRVQSLDNDTVRQIKAGETIVIEGVAPTPQVDGWTLKVSRAN